jgi:ribose transport system substrate-binding protein
MRGGGKRGTNKKLFNKFKNKKLGGKMKKTFLWLLVSTLILSLWAGFSLFGCKPIESTSETSVETIAETETAGETQAVEEETSKEIDFTSLYEEVADLQGEEALKFFESLPSKGVKGADVIQFFIDLPISKANEQIYKIFTDEGFAFYLDKYPKGEPYQGFQWERGMGTEITGPMSKEKIKLPFTDYVPLPDGPVGDQNKTYKIGFTMHGFSMPWLLDMADAALWEAGRHSNVEMKALDAEFDNAKMASHFDTFIAEGMDGILVWPMIEAPTGPPAQRAIEAGIPVVSVDRMTGFEGVSSRVTGNFPANGAQLGMYLIWKLDQEGNLNTNMILLRKPLGSTADSIRTGHLLKVLSYFPTIKILQSYHDADNREEAFLNCQAALQAYDNIDVIFGVGDQEILAAVEAVRMANRMNSRADNKKIIFLSIDDSKECITNVKNGDFDVNTPYTPFVSDVGTRTLLNIIAGVEMPHNVISPNIPMVTQNGDEIFGLQTQTPDEWYQYTYGPPIE